MAGKAWQQQEDERAPVLLQAGSRGSEVEEGKGP